MARNMPGSGFSPREVISAVAHYDRNFDLSLTDIVACFAKLESSLSDKIDNVRVQAPLTQQQPLTLKKTSGEVQVSMEAKHYPELAHSQQASVTAILRPAMLIALGMLCSRPECRSFFEMLVHKQRLDPLSVAMCAQFALYVASLAQGMPQRLSLLGSDSLSFEDAPGVSIKVPYPTYSHFKIFKAFLEVHFEGKPGMQKVLDGKYQLLDHRFPKGRQIMQQEWSVIVSKRSRVVMNLLFAARYPVFVDCSTPLGGLDEDNLDEDILSFNGELWLSSFAPEVYYF